MNEKELHALALLEVGLNLIVGDVPTDLECLLTKEEHDKITKIRSEIGIQFIRKSGLPDDMEWTDLIKQMRKK